MLSFPKRELSPQTQQSHKPQFPKSDIKHNIEHVNCRMRPVRIQRVLFYNNCPRPRINIVVLLHSRKSLVVVHQSCNLSTNINWISPNTLPDENDIPHFRHHYFHAEQPVVLRSAEFVRHSLPGYQKWFVAEDQKNGPPVRLNYEYLSQFGDAVVPLEMTTTKASSSSSSPKNRDDNEIQFQRINAPLSMFLEWMQLTSQRQLESPATATATAAFNKTQIYLAQAHISDLPSQLSQDFNPPPRLVTETGRNDIYATNLWIGSPPTYTPLHRDPNPNLFVHLSGLKRVRMLNPQNGMRVFMGVRSRVMENEEEDRRRRETTSSSSSSFIRGEEMMMGLERKLLEDSIWQQQQQQHSEKSSLAESDSSKEMVGYDVLLERGDALFIPKGWWHSLKGVGEGITASVNWWFR